MVPVPFMLFSYKNRQLQYQECVDDGVRLPDRVSRFSLDCHFVCGWRFRS